MSDPIKIDFYGQTSVDTARFVYRRLGKAVHDHPETRQDALAAAIQELSVSNPEMRKFKFILPDFLRRLFTPEEVAQFETAMAGRRTHASRLKMVYPRASDEFTLDPSFLTSVLDLEDGPRLRPGAQFFTIGSCFARNITAFLTANGHQAKTYSLAEDLNSPISNAFVFDILQRPPAARLEVLTGWLQRLFPGIGDADCQRVAAFKLQGISDLATELAEADCVIMTLGNIIDFFEDGTDPSLPLMRKVFPKFLAMSVDGDLGVDSGAVGRLKKQGATLRLASHTEACEAIACCIAGIRSISKAPIVITLSPVPVDSVIGVSKTELKTAIEVDCVSKSRLRSAFDEIAPALQSAHGPIHYFPSFEIVRWIGPMLNIPIFGREDAASRHVSATILDTVCSQFLGRFIQWTDTVAGETLAGGTRHGGR